MGQLLELFERLVESAASLATVCLMLLFRKAGQKSVGFLKVAGASISTFAFASLPCSRCVLAAPQCAMFV
ncbi:hypothetical protein VOM14_12380 [Paraburkholderia sp. MPAMCS5]|uniref:hypothetical protein n=1 Tax=Paraburkholderia sp. MPAMCS5 TaxID=3112563 RepID=UPI002E17165F|nr:hypothetical protein [Paraburkholderia sp. MPAMCS5]